MTIGPIIGSGIFISPKGILQNSGGSVGWALMMWILCGIFATLGALSLAELGNMFRKSGGIFLYLLAGYNKFFAFLQLYCFIMVARPASSAIISITMGEYFFAPFFSGCEGNIPSNAVRLFGIVALSEFFLVFIFIAIIFCK